MPKLSPDGGFVKKFAADRLAGVGVEFGDNDKTTKLLVLASKRLFGIADEEWFELLKIGS